MVCGWQSVAERRWGEWGDRLIISIETIHGCVLNGSSKIVKLQTGANRSAIRRGSAATKSLEAIAKELQGTNILVNAYSPGWMPTDMGGSNAPFTADEGAETAVYLTMLPDGGAQGKFFAEMRKFGGAIALPW